MSAACAGGVRPDESDRLLRYERLPGLAEETFGAEGTGAEVVPPAGGRGRGETPLEYARTELGAREVERRLVGKPRPSTFDPRPWVSAGVPAPRQRRV